MLPHDRPRRGRLTLSLRLMVPALNGVAMHIGMGWAGALHQLGLLRCLGWGARHGPARPPSSMETKRVRLLSRPTTACTPRQSSPTRRV